MVSPTSRTETKRHNKKLKAGKARKNKIANQGSTKSQESLFGSKLPEETAAK